MGIEGSLPVFLCVDMLTYLELYHLCEVVADSTEDVLEDVPEQLRLLRKRDRYNALSIVSESRHRGARKTAAAGAPGAVSTPQRPRKGR